MWDKPLSYLWIIHIYGTAWNCESTAPLQHVIYKVTLWDASHTESVRGRSDSVCLFWNQKWLTLFSTQPFAAICLLWLDHWRSTDRHRTYAYGLAWRKHIWLSGFTFAVIYIFFCDVKHALSSKIILSGNYYYWVAQWYRWKCYHLTAPTSLVQSWTQLSWLCRISVHGLPMLMWVSSSVSSHHQKTFQYVAL